MSASIPHQPAAKAWPPADLYPPAPRSDRILNLGLGGLGFLSIGFFAAVTIISALDPSYFNRPLLDQMITGSTDKPDGLVEGAMPVPKLVRPVALTPRDFQIVMVFGSEAHLASPGELWRVRVGSLVPGLGEILAIEPGENGGTVRAQNATLTGVRN